VRTSSSTAGDDPTPTPPPDDTPDPDDLLTDLPETGQVRCYDWKGNVIECGSDPQYPGQDADWHTGCGPDYTDNGDGTVTDRCTGLTWQKSDDFSYADWDDTLRYCDALSFGGYADWRLPNVRELQSIVLYGDNNPAIDTGTFSGSTDSTYWTSTSRSDGPSEVYIIPFVDGRISTQKRGDTGEKASRRCVRGTSGTLPDTMQQKCYSAQSQTILCGSDGQVPGQDAELDTGCQQRLVDNDDGTVTDECTGLVWEQEGALDLLDWDNALRRCDDLSSAGRSTWRLPNARELFSITRYDAYNPAADDIFTLMYSALYWTSTSYRDNGYNAWLVSFYNGVEDAEDKGSYGGTGYVRCVHPQGE